MGKPKEAMEHWKEALNISEQLDNLEWQAILLNSLSKTSERLEQYEKALIYYERLLEVHQTQRNLAEVTTDLSNIANVNYKMGNQDLAIQFYQQALDITNDLDGRVQKTKQSKYTNRIGLIFYKQGKHLQALQKFLLAMQYIKEAELEDSPLAESIKKNIRTTESKLGQ
jgi:tetratricopeptide (TPR) repeat protein